MPQKQRHFGAQSEPQPQAFASVITRRQFTQLLGTRSSSQEGVRYMHQRKPCVFIGSSSEGLTVAEAIQTNLEHDCKSVIWSQGVFGLGEGTLESLVEKADDFDFAILVVT